MVESIQLEQAIILIIAIYGACLSTYNLYIKIREDKPNIKVTTSGSFVTIPGIEGSSPPLFTISALNVGRVPVNLSMCGLILPRGDRLQFVGPDEHTYKQLPVRLSPGESIDISREMQSLFEQIQDNGYSGNIKVIVYFKDQVSNTYKSKKIKIKLN